MSLFITLEGGEGAGKTSLADALQTRIEAHGIDVLRTREPGGTVVAEMIRELLLNPGVGEAMAPATELLLMFAARAQHLAAKIRPALAQGRWVLCDRFTDATLAYQGHGRGQSIAWIEQLAEQVHGDCQPDCTLLLDIDPTKGLKRALRGREADRMESASLDFHERVREGYLSRARLAPDRIKVLDASATPEHVLEQAWDAIRPWLKGDNA
jgi:dTMP kinase